MHHLLNNCLGSPMEDAEPIIDMALATTIDNIDRAVIPIPPPNILPCTDSKIFKCRKILIDTTHLQCPPRLINNIAVKWDQWIKHTPTTSSGSITGIIVIAISMTSIIPMIASTVKIQTCITFGL